MLINAIIAFGLLFVLIVPLYIASKSSAKNKSSELLDRCVQLLSERDIAPHKQEIIGNKAFVFSKEGKVLILFKTSTEEAVTVLNKACIGSLMTREISNGGKLAEMKLVYEEAGSKREFQLYKQHRDNALDIVHLRKMSQEIKQFLN